MPSVSRKQQELFSIAEHAPGKLYNRNKGLASLGHDKLREFSATPTKSLPERKGKLYKGGK